MPQFISPIMQTFLNRPVFSIIRFGLADPGRRMRFAKPFPLENIIAYDNARALFASMDKEAG